MLQARVKLILCTCRISIGPVSLYFLIIKIPLSELVKLVCLAVDVLMGWELWNIRFVSQSCLFTEQSSLSVLPGCL